MFELKNRKIVVTGGAGFLGKAVCSELLKKGVTDIVIPRSAETDLREKDACREILKNADMLIHCAAHVGGIALNAEKPGELFYDNAVMGLHLLDAAREEGVQKVVLIGTACSYPANAPTPLKEEDLWNGMPDPVTGPYGLAKRMLLAQAQAYRAQYGLKTAYLIPTNLYGPGDTFDSHYSHVIPALITRMTAAREKNDATFSVWGSGKATRDFLFIDDAATGIVNALEQYEDSEPVNMGSGTETPIAEVVSALQRMIGYEGEVVWDKTKPDGNMSRWMDISRAKKAIGFVPKTLLEEGLRKTVDWYQKNRSVN